MVVFESLEMLGGNILRRVRELCQLANTQSMIKQDLNHLQPNRVGDDFQAACRKFHVFQGSNLGRIVHA